MGLLAMMNREGTKRSAASLLARGEQLSEAGRQPVTRVVAGELQTSASNLRGLVADQRPGWALVGCSLTAGSRLVLAYAPVRELEHELK